MPKLARVRITRYSVGATFWNSPDSMGFSFADLTFRKDVRRLKENLLQWRGTQAQSDGTVVRPFLIAQVEVTDEVEMDDVLRSLGSLEAGDTSLNFPVRPGYVPPPSIPFNAGGSAENLAVRVKPDQVARLVVVRPLGEDERAITLGRSYEEIFRTNEFLLQGAGEARQEKVQIIETFGDPQIFAYGERAKVFQYSGTLLNSENFAWRDHFHAAYDTYLRGTLAIENRTRVFLIYDDLLRDGYLIASATGQSESPPNLVTFQFQMYIRPGGLRLLRPRADLGGTIARLRERIRNRLNALAGQLAAFQNFLGIPVMFESAVTDKERDRIQGKINQAKDDGDPPYTFVIVT
jgi:hypothetical protein